MDNNCVQNKLITKDVLSHMNNDCIQTLCFNDNTVHKEMQPSAENILSDKNSKGENRPWKEYKELSLALSKMYKELHYSTKYRYNLMLHKSADLVRNGIEPIPDDYIDALENAYKTYEKYSKRLEDCSGYLEFKEFADKEKKKKLNKARFCRVRLCPMCTWRRSIKAFGQVSKMKKYIDRTEPGKYSYLFISLTIQNCWANELEEKMDEMFVAANNLKNKWKPWKRAIKGYVQAFEITRNAEKKDVKWYGSYHPHIHLIAAVNSATYFRKARDLYISHEELQNKWQKLMKLDYPPQVKIQKIEEFNAHSIAEIAKYSVKFGDYVDISNWDFSKEAVEVLTFAVHKRRFLGFGGVFNNARKQLNLENIETGDLVHTSEDEVGDEEDFKLVRYFWNGGYGEYVAKEACPD